MFITVINDCRDANAMGRQLSRLENLFRAAATPLGVANDIEAAGNLIDILDATEGEHGVVLVNVAPRHGTAKKWPNGTPFAYFKVKRTLVVASVDGYTLSLAKKLGLIKDLRVLDLPTTLDYMVNNNLFPKETADRLYTTQFRSFEFTPRVAKWLYDGIELPSEPYPLENIPDCPAAVWWIDNFGNCKTTIFANEINEKHGEQITATVGDFTHYARLKDVPNKTAALITGSSGYEDKRFIELVIQGASAAGEFKLKTGDTIFSQENIANAWYNTDSK